MNVIIDKSKPQRKLERGNSMRLNLTKANVMCFTFGYAIGSFIIYLVVK